jgi:serine/threonine-protein phosphatase 2A activator
VLTKETGISRFGNPSFRNWFDKASEDLPGVLAGLVPEDYVTEVSTYLLNSFGDRTRIDYGTGHEANFVCFLLCLYKLKILNQEDNVAIVLAVFWRYIMVMRQLQHLYWLEPAGSHGVWGLDDYHFLPFLFGSGQLHGMSEFTRPSAFAPKKHS